MYFFGCWNGAGHYLFTASGDKQWRQPAAIPFKYTILDGALLPQDAPQTEGLAHRVRFAGWTVVTWWDRSVDSRSGSCCAFVVPGDLSTEEAIKAARETFPSVFHRFRYDVRPA